MAPEDQAPPRWGPLVGPGLTLVAIALTELSLWTLPEPVPVAFLIVALLPVAYAGLAGGVGPGLLSALLLALYTAHFTSEPASPLTLSPATLQGVVIMLVIGAVMSVPMALIRRREERLRGALRDRAAELQRRNEELTEANAALEAFGYVVSHDLKEPVRAIENYLEAAQEAWGTEEGARDLDKATDANRRLVRLLHGLLSYSRASSLVPAPRALGVEEVVMGDACRAQYEPMLRERGARLEVAPGIPPVMGDEVILAQVLGNLILNSVRHNASPAPIVRIRAEPGPAPGRVDVLVEDNGPGFPADVLRRFDQLTGSRPATLRAGFGLVISHRAAQRLQGKLRLENPPGGGGRARLELPSAEDPAEKD